MARSYRFVRSTVVLYFAAVAVAIVSVLCNAQTVPAPPTKPAVPAVVSNPTTRPAYDWLIADKHKQLFDWSCIPMTIEMVLKLTGREPADYYDLQNAWQNKKDGNFRDFEGRTIAGLKFHQQFDITRGKDFPIDDLFKRIDDELDQGRFVIVSLYMPWNAYHMFVIVDHTSTGDYRAVSKSDDWTMEIANVKERIRAINGTDIMTYTVVPASANDAGEATSKPAVFKVGDKVEIVVDDLLGPGAPPVKNEATVDKDGKVTFPVLPGRPKNFAIKIAGLTPDEAAKAVAKKYSDGEIIYNETVTVSPAK